MAESSKVKYTYVVQKDDGTGWVEEGYAPSRAGARDLRRSLAVEHPTAKFRIIARQLADKLVTKVNGTLVILPTQTKMYAYDRRYVEDARVLRKSVLASFSTATSLSLNDEGNVLGALLDAIELRINNAQSRMRKAEAEEKAKLAALDGP